jgi:hypothetical protein
MTKIVGVAFALVLAIFLFTPSPATACQSCGVQVWDPDCNHNGCTYCAACDICCGGKPWAGGNCALWCGGGALASAGPVVTEQEISTSADAPAPSDVPAFLAAPAMSECSAAVSQ